jgi:DNA-binding NtrC family response regulator
MSEPKARLLVVDDEEAIRESLEALLGMEGYAVDLAVDAASGLARFREHPYDLILMDLMMPDRSGIEVIEDIRRQDREIPVFLLTAYGSVDVAVRAIRMGATNYFSKPWENEKLLLEIERTIAGVRLAREHEWLKRAFRERYRMSSIVAQSDRMLRVIELVKQAAPSRANILIQGETGTGRELIARAIHAESPRLDGPWVSLQLAASQGPLVEEALFGSVNRKAALADAQGGTLYLEDIEALPVDAQARLVRVLEDRQFLPPGATTPMAMDLRLLTSSTLDLRQQVAEGRFREDLYFQLAVVQISLPPLRERKDDIRPLVAHFAERYAVEHGRFLDGEGRCTLQMEADLMQLLLDHNWPSNVRELRSIVERIIVLSQKSPAEASVLPDYLLQAGGLQIRHDESGNLPADASLYEMLADFERKLLIDRLERHSGSQTETAEALRIPLSTLNQKIKRLAIEIKKR